MLSMSMPVGQYCNALDTLHECLEEVDEGDGLLQLALDMSRNVLGVIDEAVCSFMPRTGEQGGQSTLCVCVVCVCCVFCLCVCVLCVLFVCAIKLV